MSTLYSDPLLSGCLLFVSLFNQALRTLTSVKIQTQYPLLFNIFSIHNHGNKFPEVLGNDGCTFLLFALSVFDCTLLYHLRIACRCFNVKILQNFNNQQKELAATCLKPKWLESTAACLLNF